MVYFVHVLENSEAFLQVMVLTLYARVINMSKSQTFSRGIQKKEENLSVGKKRIMVNNTRGCLWEWAQEKTEKNKIKKE